MTMCAPLPNYDTVLNLPRVPDGGFIMSYAELIAQKLTQLSPDKQAEVFDFVEFIASRSSADWSESHFQLMSLSQAFREQTDDPVNYSASDCREIWR
jgi:hypothetical protein